MFFASTFKTLFEDPRQTQVVVRMFVRECLFYARVYMCVDIYMCVCVCVCVRTYV